MPIGGAGGEASKGFPVSLLAASGNCGSIVLPWGCSSKGFDGAASAAKAGAGETSQSTAGAATETKVVAEATSAIGAVAAWATRWPIAAVSSSLSLLTICSSVS